MEFIFSPVIGAQHSAPVEVSFGLPDSLAGQNNLRISSALGGVPAELPLELIDDLTNCKLLGYPSTGIVEWPAVTK